MAKHKDKTEQEQMKETTTEPIEEVEAQEPQTSEDDAPDTEAAQRAQIEQLKQQLAEKDDKYLRMAAEYDNFRRRSREEKDGVYDNAVADTLGELLAIIDNLERAAAYEDGEKVKEGLQMTVKTVAQALGKLGAESFGAVGDAFDPNLHNAVMHVEDESFGEGEIIEVFQKGYRKGKKVIRFAMVKTAN